MYARNVVDNSADDDGDDDDRIYRSQIPSRRKKAKEKKI